ncbi:MAG: hypothetical protein J5881_00260 [Clostridia bacterium]|nr:hypothetical protein [Clostridia bacterium]
MLNLPYVNREKSITVHQNELFDGTTKRFVSDLNLKKDIQDINNGNLSVKKFKRKIGTQNFALLAQTANFCTNDNNIEPVSSKYLANITSNYTNILFPDNAKYNKIGNDILADIDKQLAKSSKRALFLEKLKGFASMDILEVGKMLETKLQNKTQKISNDQSR